MGVSGLFHTPLPRSQPRVARPLTPAPTEGEKQARRERGPAPGLLARGATLCDPR